MTARIFHWVSAVIILWATTSGLFMAFLAAPAAKAWISWFNVSVTTLLIPLFAIRIVYALTSTKPALTLVSPRQRRAAHAGHLLLYTLTALVLLSGVLMMQRDINVFDWFSLPRVVHDAALNLRFAHVHRIGSTLLALAIVGHVLAVIQHQRRGIPVLRRMTLGTAAVSPACRAHRAGPVRLSAPSSYWCRQRRRTIRPGSGSRRRLFRLRPDRAAWQTPHR